MEPTPIQRNIIQEEGNTVVLSMPGSGKTFVLSEKIRRILESDVLKIIKVLLRFLILVKLQDI